jgi:hypothetical protein
VPEVHLTFLDGEVVRADTDLIDFGQPVIRARSIEAGSNNEELTVPLSSLKYIVMGAAEGEPESDEMGKVVIHFTDHEVLRAYAGRDTLGGPYGVIYTLIEPTGKVRRRIGVPYTAVKAIFKVKSWDGRGKTKPAAARRAAPKKGASRKVSAVKTPPNKAAAPKKPAPKRAPARKRAPK